MGRLISKFTVAGPNARFLARLNEIIDAVNSAHSINSPNTLTNRTTQGTSHRPTGGTSSSSRVIENPFRGEWSADETYSEGEWVVVRGGTSAGSYISTADGNTSEPWNSATWVQFADNNSIGRWGG